MAMTKKDFIALADELRPVLADLPGNDPGYVWADTMNALCRFMRSRNPNFKEDLWRSYLAGECGPNGGRRK